MKHEIIGYLAIFPERDELMNMDGTIVVFGRKNDFQEYLNTLETDGGDDLSVLQFKPVCYEQVTDDVDGRIFALDETSYNKYRKIAAKRGIALPAKDFYEEDESLIKFATLKKKKILH